MAQHNSKEKDTVTLLAYFLLIGISFYLIAYLNIFPGAVSYEEKSEGIVVTQGSLEKSSVTVNVEDYETSDWLLMSLLQANIRKLQSFLTLFSALIPMSIFFLLEHKRLDFLKISKTLRILSIALVFFVPFLLLTIGYVDVLERIEQGLAAILIES
ncbi:hypothetical protein AUC31_14500 [Planococcus rifietoensis]|uniref:Uncharacterized protein n=1 Tax=Planococcus rifietoensis TaxID=200991 RepID=A0A0U2Z8W4_9BACL|nr:hypothetical protein [Planococcus rifietoensis]ALS76331.1 hypothetical protein AUC31_14500 [Planococcus rifietoensis]